MPSNDNSYPVLDETGRVVSGKSPARRNVRSRKFVSQPALVAELAELAEQMVGLTIEQAANLVEASGHILEVDYVQGSEFAPPVFRFNHLTAFVENGRIVAADPG